MGDSEPLPFHQLDVGEEIPDAFKLELQDFRVDLFAERSQRRERFAEVVHDLGVTTPFGGRHPLEAQPCGVHPDLLQQFPGKMHGAQGEVVPFSDVVALAGPAASDENPVGSIGKSPEDEAEVDPARAHEADDLDAWRVL